MEKSDVQRNERILYNVTYYYYYTHNIIFTVYNIIYTIVSAVAASAHLNEILYYILYTENEREKKKPSLAIWTAGAGDVTTRQPALICVPCDYRRGQVRRRTQRANIDLILLLYRSRRRRLHCCSRRRMVHCPS
ncbi:unnamed protein product [Aphis gossypii]|uniref:Uncharacterized protein n=1 Tax=Aphis gossypii TaxID=80765 RepID=A0A9P0IWF9_APHGO|nr:unnamed protein product [Aphis gossypii]